MPRIHDLPPSSDPRRVERSDARRAERTARPEGSGEAAKADSVELSEEGRQVQDLRDRLTEAARGMPEVREDRVAQARARLAAGEYDSEGVSRQIADRLLEQFGL